MPNLDKDAINKYHELGLHPLYHPLGDGHHTDIPLTESDKKIGDSLAWFLGTLFADVEDDERYWHDKMTPIDEWSRVARALRIHGLCISDRQDNTNLHS